MIIYRVKELRNQHPHAGARKTQKMLADPSYGIPVAIGRDRFLDLLRSRKMLCVCQSKKKSISNSKHFLKIYPNLLKGLSVTTVNQIWVSDITYLHLPGKKFCYLYLVTDLFSRKIVGYALTDNLTSAGTEAAFLAAVKLAVPGAGLIHHSDHGIQYCCKSYTSLLEQHQVRISMTGENRCYDNAVAERVNETLKYEYGLGLELPSFEAAKSLTDDGIMIYNSARLHLSLGYRTPDNVYYSSQQTA
jgi:putative transposase